MPNTVATPATPGTEEHAWRADDRVDPYLRTALALDWVDHDVTQSGMRLTFELQPGCAVSALRGQLSTHDRVCSHWRGEHAVFGTAWLSLASARRWAAGGPPACVARFEVGMPWRDGRSDRSALPALSASVPVRTQPCPSAATSPSLRVIIDHGCPFAHPGLRRPDGQTQILRLWDQDMAPELGDLARRPEPWAYGADLDRSELTRLLQEAEGDEARCYARMGYRALQRRAVHGAHVLGHMVSEPADDVVFVQLPRAQLQTLSRAALMPYVLDGAMYALSVAAPGTRVIVNLSLEAYDGPHDAVSLWACALQALVWHAREVHRVRWTWVVAAGNAASLNVNATVPLPADVPQTLVWRVPPASEHVAWLELWWPEAMGALSLCLTAPGEAKGWQVPAGALTAWPSWGQPACLVAYPQAVTPSGRCLMVRLAPTSGGLTHQGIATAGDWKLQLHSPVAGTVRAYLARVWQGLGGHARGVQGRLLVGEDMGEDMGAMAQHDLMRPETPPRSDSLNGLACDMDGLVVAQAMQWQAGQLTQTAYSGRGRARAVSAHLCETSALLHGLRGWGALGGQSVRMNGTSVAAPQAVRALAWADRRAPP